MNWDTFALWLRNSHITIGFVGLASYWIAVLAKKGSKPHIFAGRAFEWCGYYVATTALFSCARYLSQARHFAFVNRPDESAQELARVEFAQFLLTLLAFLAIVFLVQLRNGVRVVRTRKLGVEAYQNWEAKLWLIVQTLASLWLVSFGAYRLATGGSAIHWASVVVGAIPLTELKKELHFYRNPRELKMSWWYKHMDCMLGCGVAFHTAALLFSFRWLEKNTGFALPGIWQVVPWIIPTVVGVPLSQWWIAQNRAKFGDGKATGTPPIAATASSVD